MWIASLPCLITDREDVQACHIRKHGKAGVGLKSSDSRTVPLSCHVHAAQHHVGETKFWKEYGGIHRAILLAEDLYSITGNTEAALELIGEWKNGR